MAPWVSRTEPTVSSTDLSSVTSSGRISTLEPSRSHRSRSRSPLAVSRIVAMVVSLRRAKATADSRPIPLLQPVIRTTLMMPSFWTGFRNGRREEDALAS